MQSIFVRSETFQNEYRTPLVPEHVSILIKKGIQVYIESSQTRFFSDKAYSDISGCIVTEKSWTHPQFQKSLILGIKELTDLQDLSGHTHVYFSHSFKQQGGARDILQAFSKSYSKLYDCEYFTDTSGNRIIAFGWYAGVVGAALGLQEYAQKTTQGHSLQNLTPWHSLDALLNSIPQVSSPKIAVLGPYGRCGQGVCYILEKLHLEYTSFPKESSIDHLEEFDIVYNCILLDEGYSKTWYTQSTVFHRTTVIVDISCDYSKKNNPIQLYSKPTNWAHPVYMPNDKVSIIAIENLPSLLPVESSNHFSKQLLPLLVVYPNDCWKKALDIFYLKAQTIKLSTEGQASDL